MDIPTYAHTHVHIYVVEFNVLGNLPFVCSGFVGQLEQKIVGSNLRKGM
jgi:hypothetical protein